MSENTEEFSDNETPIEDISETLETEDVVDTTEIQDVCDIVNMMNEKKPKEIKIIF